MTITKESLLEFALTASDEQVVAVASECLARLTEIGAVGVGFTPIAVATRPAGELTADDVMGWIPTVRQPTIPEMSNRQTRNLLVYEVEKLGEFHQTLSARLAGSLLAYVH